jgi:pyruvate kinase
VQRNLAAAGATSTKLVSRVGSTAALLAFDDILAASDGIIMARGDLAMEIPSEKVALAQKMMVTKANIAGKFIITQAKVSWELRGWWVAHLWCC